ncbi:uncharacterized protein LOC134457169 [Engraulis encrasicolus]|uniref:uncharacterized protein LOC134457169 n=1 Tax=Engraulis encrasicolus TaxID=184585 RepID=UPI002FD1F836
MNPSVNDQAQKYSDKLSAINNVDPYELPDSAWGKDLDALPPYSYGDFYEYLLYKLRCVTKEEMRSSFKSRDGWSQFRNGWVKDIHIYKPENCENTVVLAKVIHPQQQSYGHNNSGSSSSGGSSNSGGSLPPPATPWAILAPSGAVCTAHCTCMADAAEQTCGHVEALLLKTEEALRTKDEEPVEMARLFGCTSAHAAQRNGDDDDDEDDDDEDYEDDEDEYDDEDGYYGNYIDYDYYPEDYDEVTDDINKLPGMMVRVRGQRTRQLCLYTVVEEVNPETGVSSKSLRMTDDFTNTDPAEEIARKKASVVANHQQHAEKLAAMNNVDKLPESVWRKDRLRALPPTTIDHLYEYLVKRVGYVTRTDFMRYKDLMPFKQYCEGYVKNLHIYRPENCENTVVLAKFIYPKSPEQPMTPWIILEPSGRVSSSHCTCQGDSCTHVEALLFKTQDSVLMRQKESATNALWFIPGNVGYEVKPKRLSEIDFSGDYGDSDDDEYGHDDNDDEDGYETVEDNDDDDEYADDGGAGDASNTRRKMLSPPTEEEKRAVVQELVRTGPPNG